MTGLMRLKIKLKGGGPWGFRLQGGPGTGSPLTVSKVRRKSKAYNNLREGDRLVTANGVPCDNLTYDQVMAIADQTGSEFNLEIERKEEKIEDFSSGKICPDKFTKSNSTITLTETKTTVTEMTNDMMSEKSNSARTDGLFPPTENSSAVLEPKPQEPSKPKVPDVIIEPLENEVKFEPEITSDISSKTTSEVTPTGEKFEKLETEKIHEKEDNKETTIIRTDYEERVKSHTTSSSPPGALESESKAKDHFPCELSEKTENITSESYEVHKTEKEEIKTTKMNGFPPETEDGIPNIESIASTVADVASKCFFNEQDLRLPFATPVTTIDSVTEIDEKSGSITVTKKKKMFSSSSFYEEPNAKYPTVEEQFEMAKKIAESLADDTNKKSKGANMFFKRAKRSTKWIHEGPEPSPESAPDTPEILPEYPPTELVSDGSDSLKRFPKLKLVFDPRHPLDLHALRSTGHNISEHNVISPEVCHELVRDLESPKGKGSALFAKRKKKSSEWVVDEEKVKALMQAHERELNQVRQNLARSETPQSAPFRSPWDPSFYIPSASPHPRVNPEKLAETVIAAADVKRRDSIQMVEEPMFEPCHSPIIPATPAASYYDIYKPRAPKGWSTTSFQSESSGTVLDAPSSIYTQHTPHSEPFPSYASLTSPQYTRKFNFQNFNTLPRKWKARQ